MPQLLDSIIPFLIYCQGNINHYNCALEKESEIIYNALLGCNKYFHCCNPNGSGYKDLLNPSPHGSMIKKMFL